MTTGLHCWAKRGHSLGGRKTERLFTRANTCRLFLEEKQGVSMFKML
jgi:hypothetical protein